VTTKKKQYKDYESAMERLEEITQLLESGDTPLEQAIDLYTEGLKIVKFCNMKLTEAEKKIKVITEKNGLVVETDLDSEDGRE
jgi:exodeoxyribonuclease VII small subunit